METSKPLRNEEQGYRQLDERLRRTRLGQLRRVLRLRYGHTLPDDDAGREDLGELLRLRGLHPTNPVEHMRREIELSAPWMSEQEGTSMIDNVLILPARQRWSSKKDLGECLRLTDRERIAARAWSIQPVDSTEEELRERARERARLVRRLRRLDRGMKPHALSVARAEPWKALGISKRTYYRRKAAGLLGVGTNLVAMKLLIQRPNRCHATDAAVCQTEDDQPLPIITFPSLGRRRRSEAERARPVSKVRER